MQNIGAAEITMCANISLDSTIVISSGTYPARVYGNGLSIHGHGSVRLFEVAYGGSLQLRNITLEGGSLTTTSTTFTGNSTLRVAVVRCVWMVAASRRPARPSPATVLRMVVR